MAEGNLVDANAGCDTAITRMERTWMDTRKGASSRILNFDPNFLYDVVNDEHDDGNSVIMLTHSWKIYL